MSEAARERRLAGALQRGLLLHQSLFPCNCLGYLNIPIFSTMLAV
jgi:hypothetical protein